MKSFYTVFFCKKNILNLRLYKRNSINDQCWNECINESPQGLLFAYTWYLDITTKDWWAIILEDKGEYKWVMPFPISKKRGFYFIQMPLFTPELGYFSTLENPDFWVYDAIILIQKNVSYCIEYIGNSDNKFPNSHNGEDLTIDLNEKYETTFSKFSKVKRKNSRQSKKRNSTPILDQNIHGFLKLINKNTFPKIGITSPLPILKILENLLCKLVDKNRIRIYSIYNEKGIIEASSIFLHHKNRWQYFLNTGENDVKNKFGRLAIINHFLKNESDQKNALHLGTYINTPTSTSHYKNVVRPYFEQLTKEKVDVPFITWNHLPWYINYPHQLKKWIYHSFFIKQ